jgi:hypothetical protein
MRAKVYAYRIERFRALDAKSGKELWVGVCLAGRTDEWRFSAVDCAYSDAGSTSDWRERGALQFRAFRLADAGIFVL